MSGMLMRTLMSFNPGIKLQFNDLQLHTRRTLRALIVYNALLFVVFTVIYRYYALRRMHTGMKHPTESTWERALYFAAVTQFSFTAPVDNIDSLTPATRAVVGIHSFMSWLSVFGVILSIHY